MIRSRMTSERLASLFLLGVLLFNPPLLLIFDFPDYVLGIPVLYIYLFTAWAVLVGGRLAGETNWERNREDCVIRCDFRHPRSSIFIVFLYRLLQSDLSR